MSIPLAGSLIRFRVAVAAGMVWLLFLSLCPAGGAAGRSGPDIMAEVFSRHAPFPFVYEEQTIILEDGAGHKDVKKARQFFRITPEHTLKYLLVFDAPREIRGVAFRMVCPPAGPVEKQIYLPALGKALSPGPGFTSPSRYIPGMDVALENLAEPFDRGWYNQVRYERRPDQTLDRVPYFVVDARCRQPAHQRDFFCVRRRFFIRQDIFFIVRTDCFDGDNHLVKQFFRYDLHLVDGKMWQASLLLMEDKIQALRTLVKIDQRVFSRDYVPDQVFSLAWLKETYPMADEQPVRTDRGK